jgi:hypothetical protein
MGPRVEERIAIQVDIVFRDVHMSKGPHNLFFFFVKSRIAVHGVPLIGKTNRPH